MKLFFVWNKAFCLKLSKWEQRAHSSTRKSHQVKLQIIFSFISRSRLVMGEDGTHSILMLRLNEMKCLSKWLCEKLFGQWRNLQMRHTSPEGAHICDSKQKFSTIWALRGSHKSKFMSRETCVLVAESTAEKWSMPGTYRSVQWPSQNCSPLDIISLAAGQSTQQFLLILFVLAQVFYQLVTSHAESHSNGCVARVKLPHSVHHGTIFSCVTCNISVTSSQWCITNNILWRGMR